MLQVRLLLDLLTRRAPLGGDLVVLCAERCEVLVGLLEARLEDLELRTRIFVSGLELFPLARGRLLLLDDGESSELNNKMEANRLGFVNGGPSIGTLELLNLGLELAQALEILDLLGGLLDLLAEALEGLALALDHLIEDLPIAARRIKVLADLLQLRAPQEELVLVGGRRGVQELLRHVLRQDRERILDQDVEVLDHMIQLLLGRRDDLD